MATTVFAAKAKADGYVDITFVIGEATRMGKSGTFTVTVPYDKPLRSTLFTEEGSDEVCPDDPSVGLWTWSLGTDGISDFTPEELLEFCPTYDVTLYAAYSKKYTVTFDLQGGSYQGSKTCTYTVLQGRRYNFSDIVPDIADADKAFGGCSDAGEEVDYDCFEMKDLLFTEDRTYYAVYVKASRVRFHATEGYFEDQGKQYAQWEVKAPIGHPLSFRITPQKPE